MKRKILIITGILGVLIGMAFVLPAVALMRATGALPVFSVALLLLGILLTLAGGGAAVRGLKAASR